MHIVYLALGSNKGNKRHYIKRALDEINNRIGHIVRQSDLIITEPEGFQSPNLFMNMVVCVESELTPTKILDVTQHVERSLGRTQKSTDGIYHDRTIDIDILLYDRKTIRNSRLVIPHPRMTQRRFVMQPLSQIAPDLIIPGETHTVAELLTQLLSC